VMEEQMADIVHVQLGPIAAAKAGGGRLAPSPRRDPA
jgi:hypothetical protein